VHLRRRVQIDLGGIAKGFAVDRAVEALQKSGVKNGIVNAGGDARVFGHQMHEFHLRRPACPTIAAGIVRLRDRAIATSATYFSRAALVDHNTRRGLQSEISVTVAAADCMTADALTKVVFVLNEKAAPILQKFRADALILERNGAPAWLFRANGN
jgi:thiamine biosynthesis lipoprotein